MNDFAKAIVATLVGAGIAFLGTWYSTTYTARKEFRAELRQKVEQLMAGVVRSNKCFDTLVIKWEEPKDCDEQEPLWKAITIAELYFPTLVPEVTAFQEELLAAKVGILTCEPPRRKLTQADRDKRDTCAQVVYAKFNPSGRLDGIFRKAKLLMSELQ